MLGRDCVGGDWTRTNAGLGWIAGYGRGGHFSELWCGVSVRQCERTGWAWSVLDMRLPVERGANPQVRSGAYSPWSECRIPALVAGTTRSQQPGSAVSEDRRPRPAVGGGHASDTRIETVNGVHHGGGHRRAR